MKPVFQTVKHNPPHSIGNCYRACIASILEIGIDDIPPFETMTGFSDKCVSGDDWHKAYMAFFEKRGLFPSLHRIEDGRVPAGYSILSGRSPRIDGGHCVVSLDGEIVHDPAGKNAEPIRVFWYFVKIIPAEQLEVQCHPSRILDRYYRDWTTEAELKAGNNK